MKKKNTQLQALVLEHLRKNPVLEIACQKVEISRMTLHRWRQEDSAFDAAIEAAILDGRLIVNDLAENQLIVAVKERNLPAITYWLRHHHPSYKAKVEIEGSTKIIHELSPEQWALRERALRLVGADPK
jgi:hypothetical protein